MTLQRLRHGAPCRCEPEPAPGKRSVRFFPEAESGCSFTLRPSTGPLSPKHRVGHAEKPCKMLGVKAGRLTAEEMAQNSTVLVDTGSAAVHSSFRVRLPFAVSCPQGHKMKIVHIGEESCSEEVANPS